MEKTVNRQTERLYAQVKNNDQQVATGPMSLSLYFGNVAHSALS